MMEKMATVAMAMRTKEGANPRVRVMEKARVRMVDR
jgi:hypothetical protein